MRVIGEIRKCFKVGSETEVYVDDVRVFTMSREKTTYGCVLRTA